MGQFTSRVWKAKEVKILMMGLDAAGKTTILYTLKLGEVVTTIPTLGFCVETVQQKKLGLTFNAFDIGGRCKIRPLLKYYYKDTDAVIYIVDSTDEERLDDALSELFMLLCNKQDRPNALTAEAIYEKFAEISKNEIYRDVTVFPVSGIRRGTLKEPLKWLSAKLANRETWNVAKSTVTEENELVKPITNLVGYFKQSWFYLKSFIQPPN